MSDTRRQIFKLSVLSALGLAACQSDLVKPQGGVAASDPQDIGLLVHTNVGWIYLEPVPGWLGGISHYSAYLVQNQGSAIKNYNLATIANLTTNHPTGPMTPQITGTSATLAIDANSSVDPSELNKLGQFTWNEIGSKIFSA